MDRDMWDAVTDTNLGSCYNLCKVTFQDMRERKFGRIVNIGSVNGQAGQYGQVNYAAAKSGIHGFTKALAQEGAKFGITVNAIAPGYVDTEMVRAVPPDVLQKIIARIPVGRLGTPGDIARGSCFSREVFRCRQSPGGLRQYARRNDRLWRKSTQAGGELRRQLHEALG
jgi:acetoacetyl-CoA reductase